MKRFEEPMFEIEKLAVEDVIAVSGGGNVDESPSTPEEDL